MLFSLNSLIQNIKSFLNTTVHQNAVVENLFSCKKEGMKLIKYQTSSP